MGVGLLPVPSKPEVYMDGFLNVQFYQLEYAVYVGFDHYYLVMVCVCIFLIFIHAYLMNFKVNYQHYGLYPVTFMTRKWDHSKYSQYSWHT